MTVFAVVTLVISCLALGFVFGRQYTKSEMGYILTELEKAGALHIHKIVVKENEDEKPLH